MSSNRRRLPGYLLHKPTGQARVRINGHDHDLGVYDSPASWERYHQLLAARKSPGAIITAPAPSHDITITELAAAYLEWASDYYVKNGRPTSQGDVIRMALRALRKLYGEGDAKRFGPLALEALQRSLVDDDRTRSYVNKVCRPTDVCMIRPADVDTTAEIWVYTPAEHKTEHHGRERRIFIGPKAQDILRPYLLRPADQDCFRSETTRRTARGHFTNDTYGHKITAACKKAGLKPWKANQLLHATGTAVRRKYRSEAAQSVLGHSRADVAKTSAERDWSMAAEVMKAIG